MNYSMDNKIWRVGGPLFTYLGINFMMKLFFNLGLFYSKFKELNVNAAFNGVLYANELNQTEQVYAVLISGLSAFVSIFIFIRLIKNDYEYPVNRKHRERRFNFKLYAKKLDRGIIPLLIFIGFFATLGLSRLILMLPVDGILGDYSSVKATYEAGNIWIQVLMLGVVIPIAEELLFRGLVYRRLKFYYDVSIAAYISAIIFGVAHFNLIQGIYAFIMGIVFTIIYEKADNIYATIIVHISSNLMAVFTFVNPISLWLERHGFIKFMVVAIETALFIQLIAKFYKKSDTKKADSNNDASDSEHEIKQQNHKIDFHI